MSVGVVLPAAGQGKRMGTKESKQFLLFHHKPIFLHTIQAFEKNPQIDQVVVVVRESELKRTQNLLDQYSFKKVREVVVGGRERQESVYFGLKYLDTDFVLVHDAVRPFVTSDAISRLIAEVKQHDAAILAVPMKDTVKTVKPNSYLIQDTIDRTRLWSVQTPQAFRRTLLIEAHEKARQNPEFATDDSALVERIGVNVRIVEGEYTNIKITTPEDLIFAEAIYQMKG